MNKWVYCDIRDFIKYRVDNVAMDKHFHRLCSLILHGMSITHDEVERVVMRDIRYRS